MNFLAVLQKKAKNTPKINADRRNVLPAARFYSATGNDALTVSTAALSFASMEMMLQSMAAVKTTAKREVLFMAVSFRKWESGFKKLFS